MPHPQSLPSRRPYLWGRRVDDLCRCACRYTALYCACSQGAHELVPLLLAAGADADARDSSGATPLYVACLHGHAACAQILCSAGAALDVPKNSGVTPLMIASHHGHHCSVQASRRRTRLPVVHLKRARCVQVMLAAGANPTITAPVLGTQRTALQLAFDAGHSECAALLCAADARRPC